MVFQTGIHLVALAQRVPLQTNGVADLVLGLVVGILLPLLAVSLLWGIHDRVQELTSTVTELAATIERIDDRLARLEPEGAPETEREE